MVNGGSNKYNKVLDDGATIDYFSVDVALRCSVYSLVFAGDRSEKGVIQEGNPL